MRFWVLSLLFLSFSANARISLNAEIHDIDYGVGKENPFLLLKSGEVVWVKKADLPAIEAQFAAEFKTISGRDNFSYDKLDFDDPYVPTIIEDLNLAKSYFQGTREVDGSTQCFNRAHIWSYELFKHHQVLSNKTFVFFTRRYIRKYNHQWWFHVAPSVVVNEEGVLRERVMDKTFAKGPLTVKKWTDIFLKDHAHCPRVEKYSDYANYPESGSCFTMRSSMHYYQPFDLESQETWNTVKPDWYESDLKQAYKEVLNEDFEGMNL